MRFKVGACDYQLRITQGALKLEGWNADAATLEETHEILIAGTAKPKDRADLLLRELARAWAYETGEPATADGWYDLAKTMAVQAIHDLTLQGGTLALESLQPGECLEPMAARLGIGSQRRCACCGGTVAGGSVAVRPSPLPGVAELRLYCDHCGRTQVWTEAVNARGLPTNIPMGEPRFERGDTTGIELTAV